MVRWFFHLLYGAILVRFESQYCVQESVERLAAVVKPSVFSSFSGQCAVGNVTEKKVAIHRVILLVGNAWKPFFYGSFSPAGAGAVLIGAFTFSAFTRAFMSIWFGFIAFWTVLATAAVITKSPSNFWFPLFGVGMFAVGIAMVRTGKWFARNDVSWLTQVIACALGANGAQPGSPPDGPQATRKTRAPKR